MSWQAAQWALTEAPMPANDPPARAVLGYLAVKADRNGRSAFPLALSIAHDVGLNPEVVPRVLKRLVGYGLISKDGVGPQGQARWVLHMDKQHDEESFESFCARHRERESARKSKYRSRQTSRTVSRGLSTTDSPGQAARVHDSQSSCPGSTVVMSRTHSPDVPDCESPQINQHQSLDQSEINHSAASAAVSELPLDGVPSSTAPVAVDTAGAFSRFWQTYPRKVGKKAAEKAFRKAIKDGADPENVIAGAERYAASRRGQEVRFTAHPTTWLNQGRWDDDPEPAPPNSSGHTPYRDPDDQSIYDESL